MAMMVLRLLLLLPPTSATTVVFVSSVHALIAKKIRRKTRTKGCTEARAAGRRVECPAAECCRISRDDVALTSLAPVAHARAHEYAKNSSFITEEEHLKRQPV